MQRLFAPAHAGRVINARIPGGNKFTVVFDDGGFTELDDVEAQHIIACGNNLIKVATEELVAEVMSQEPDDGLTYMQKFKMRMQGDNEEENGEDKSEGKGQAKKVKEKVKNIENNEKVDKVKFKDKTKVKTKTKHKKVKTTL